MPVIMEKKTDHYVAIFARANIEVRPEAIKKKLESPIASSCISAMLRL
jgi:hypothetical protein